MVTQPTYEEMVTKVASLTKLIDDIPNHYVAKTATNDEEDKKNEASFKKAMKDMDEHTKESMTDMDKVKDAFKLANDETDPEKKKDAMKKAIHEKEDYDQKTSKKGSKQGMDEPNPKTEKKDAKVAALEDKFKLPIMNKILEATSIIAPTTLEARRKELTAATLEQVEKEYNRMEPFVAALGLSAKTVTGVVPTTMVPFQASIALEPSNSTDVKTASIDDIDFSKVKTSDIEGMYQ